MEVGPFRTVPASQTESGQVEVKLVEGGWEEFATIIFGQLAHKVPYSEEADQCQSTSHPGLGTHIYRLMGIFMSLTKYVSSKGLSLNLADDAGLPTSHSIHEELL